MKKLAIEGHETRNEEVIKLLEMLGGKNTKRFWGDSCVSSPIYYYIKSGEILCSTSLGDNYKAYTLEDFFQNFPFKVGDKVRIPEYESKVRIVAMKYFNIESTAKVEHVSYAVYCDDEEEWYTEEDLLAYNDAEDYKSRYTKSKDSAVVNSRTLGIKGHSSRSEDVKSLLTMLGGRIDVEDLPFDVTNFVFYIGNDKCVYCTTESSFNGIIYSLEEFEEKFPYKVGDKVIIKCKNKKAIVNNVVWCCNTISYWLKYDDIIEGKWKTEHLQSYKEETITIDDFKANTKEWLIDKLESMSKENTLQTISNLYHEIHKPKYPKTYEKCCKVLEIQSDWHLTFELDNTATDDLYVNKEFDYIFKLEVFRKLLICRDAYWKITGEYMELGKAWEPDWKNGEQKKYCIYYDTGIIQKGAWSNHNSILAFPTIEMRDAFYENFKDLIEKCKELL